MRQEFETIKMATRTYSRDTTWTNNFVCAVKVQRKGSSYVPSVASLALLEFSNGQVGVVCVIVQYNFSLRWKCFEIYV